ncbi:MAG: hypothetical protein FWC50_09100 [Planctomycetaceae bacterium]|nr:hypothetical protein [Planctomycetaceae bacterium]
MESSQHHVYWVYWMKTAADKCILNQSRDSDGAVESEMICNGWITIGTNRNELSKTKQDDF